MCPVSLWRVRIFLAVGRPVKSAGWFLPAAGRTQSETAGCWWTGTPGQRNRKMWSTMGKELLKRLCCFPFGKKMLVVVEGSRLTSLSILVATPRQANKQTSRRASKACSHRGRQAGRQAGPIFLLFPCAINLCRRGPIWYRRIKTNCRPEGRVQHVFSRNELMGMWNSLGCYRSRIQGLLGMHSNSFSVLFYGKQQQQCVCAKIFFSQTIFFRNEI